MAMQYTTTYSSPLGEILLAGDEIGLTGLWFQGERFHAHSLNSERQEKEISLFQMAKHWLDIYFKGQEPDFMLPIHMIGTPFRLSVWKILQKIPYGTTTTYGKIAQEIAQERGILHMSAQAIGGAVGHNNISIIIPCHRVIGANGNLTGYGGGIDKKKKLLKLEGYSFHSPST